MLLIIFLASSEFSLLLPAGEYPAPIFIEWNVKVTSEGYQKLQLLVPMTLCYSIHYFCLKYILLCAALRSLKKPKVAITMIVTWDSQVWSIILSPWSLDVDCIPWDLLVPNLTPQSFCHHVNSNVKYLPSPSGMCINSDMSSQATNTPHI